MTTLELSRKEIGRRVAAARALRGWDQKRLAERLQSITGDDSWNAGLVSNIETGRKRLGAELVPILATELRQPVEWFYESQELYPEPPSAADVAKGPELQRGRVISITQKRARLHAVHSQQAGVLDEAA